MKCAHHPEADASGICPGCGKALCAACQVCDEGVLCATCLTRHNEQVIHRFYKEIGFSVLLIFVAEAPIGLAAKSGLCLMFAFLPFGWGAMTKYFSTGAEFQHPGLRLSMLAGHLFLAALLGVIVGPIRIINAIQEIRLARAVNAAVRNR